LHHLLFLHCHHWSLHCLPRWVPTEQQHLHCLPSQYSLGWRHRHLFGLYRLLYL
jgi:hypothetical protein